jgi:hypothetical protein
VPALSITPDVHIPGEAEPVGLLVSALLALSAAEPTVPAHAVHAGRLTEGFVRSRFIRKGMTFQEVNSVLGSRPDEVGCIFAMYADYKNLGVTVWYDGTASGFPVFSLTWHFRPIGN